MSTIIIAVTPAGNALAKTIKTQLTDAEIVMHSRLSSEQLLNHTHILFIGALGLSLIHI